MRSKLACRFWVVLILVCGAWGVPRVAGQEWERVGPPGGNAISLTSAGGGVLYLGMPDGHIFSSKDGAGHWELRGRVGARIDGVVQRLLVDARAPGRLWAAVWFQDPAAGGGVFRSDDAGRTWMAAGLAGEAVRVIEQAPSAPGILLAGTRSGVLRSNDDGKNWTRITPEGDAELRNVDSLAVDPRDAQIMYVGTYHLPWKTVDGGAHWSAVTAGMIDDSDVMSLRVDAQHPERVFASACSGIYRSENGGAQWTKLQGIPYSSRRTQVLVQDPDDAAVIYAGTTEGLWLTRDHGENWMRASPREWVINGVAFTEGSGGQAQRVVLATEQQGVLVSDDGARTFVPANSGFAHRVVADLVGDLQDAQHFLARVPGMAAELQETRDGGKAWTALEGGVPFVSKKLVELDRHWLALGDAGGLADYDAAKKAWRKWKFLVMQARRVTPRKNQEAENGNSKARVQVITKEVVAQVFDARMAGGRLWVATERGLWTGSAEDRVLRLVAEKTISGAVRSVEVAADGRELWILQLQELRHSTDGGVSWSSRLPMPPATPLWLRVLPQSPTSFFAGTTGGTFVSRNSGQSWELLQAGLPPQPADPPYFAGGLLLISLRAGGLYLSVDSVRSWSRVDGPAEQGVFTGVAIGEKNSVWAGSRTEGVLRRSGTNPEK